MNDLTKMLGDRGKRYGDFASNADVSQALKDTLHASSGWDKLRPVHKECLEQICLKISRIVTGDPEYVDNWDDIAGYAKITSERSKENDRNRPVFSSQVDKGSTSNSV
jgi:hypothetical protein